MSMVQLSPPVSGSICRLSVHGERISVIHFFICLFARVFLDRHSVLSRGHCWQAKCGDNDFPALSWRLLRSNPSPPVRGELLFKDGITKPAAPVSAPIVIESSLVECASEGVCTPQ